MGVGHAAQKGQNRLTELVSGRRQRLFRAMSVDQAPELGPRGEEACGAAEVRLRPLKEL